MMTKEQLAALLNGREYLKEITREEEAQAEAAGLLVIFGQSDDLVELLGTEDDECGAFGGTTLRITGTGKLLPDFDCLDKDDEDALEAYFKDKARGFVEVKAIWCAEDDGPAWTFETAVPHAVFTIMEGGEPFCRGIVISVADLEAAAPQTAHDALVTDAACFRFWVSEAARSPGAMAKAIMYCTTEAEYRAVLVPMMQAAGK